MVLLIMDFQIRQEMIRITITSLLDGDHWVFFTNMHDTHLIQKEDYSLFRRCIERKERNIVRLCCNRMIITMYLVLLF